MGVLIISHHGYAHWVAVEISLNGLDQIFRILNCPKPGLDRGTRSPPKKAIIPVTGPYVKRNVMYVMHQWSMLVQIGRVGCPRMR